MTWYPLGVKCPSCNGVSNDFVQVCFSADGELKFSTACHNCKAIVEFHAYGTTLQHDALIKDLMGAVVRKKEPKLLPKPNDTAGDNEFLRQLHITVDDTKEGGVH